MQGRLPIKKRSKFQIAPLEHEFKGAIASLLAKFESSGGFIHRLTKGLQRERILIEELFSKTFPSRYEFTSGEIHDSQGASSGQMDILIYNALQHFVFYSDLYTILPAEAALCSIEVKSKLDKNALTDALKAADKLKSLRPFNNNTTGPRKDGAAADDGKIRYFYCLFAFSSTHEGDGWGKEVANTLIELSKELDVPISAIDRVYSVGQGLLIPEDAEGNHVCFRNNEDKADALFRLYLDILNFCDREDSRRPRSDLNNYAGKPSTKPQKWKAPKDV